MRSYEELSELTIVNHYMLESSGIRADKTIINQIGYGEYGGSTDVYEVICNPHNLTSAELASVVTNHAIKSYTYNTSTHILEVKLT